MYHPEVSRLINYNEELISQIYHVNVNAAAGHAAVTVPLLYLQPMFDNFSRQTFPMIGRRIKILQRPGRQDLSISSIKCMSLINIV